MEATIRTAITNALHDCELPPVDFTVEHPNELAHGDYASNVALVAAKAAGQPPRELAEQLVQALSDHLPDVQCMEVAGPGFVNFTLKRTYFSATVEQVRAQASEWGSSDTLAGQTILVEYTDPNPFKEFHVGHLFTNAVGESIARLCMMGGAHTKRVNYQGDVGLHVAHAIWGMQQLGHTDVDTLTPSKLGNAYAHGSKAYRDDPHAAAAIKTINKQVYDRSDATINALYDVGRTVSLAYFEEMYAQLGTTFDAYFFESEAGPRGTELVRAHPTIFPESDGAHVFRGEEHGLHTRVFLNAEGLPTYEAKELALASLKAERLGSYDRSLIVTANEITEYFRVILCALSQLHPDLAAKTEHIGHGMVRLASGKMSSRTGAVIPARDFLADVTDAAAERMRASGSIAVTDERAHAVALAAIKYVTLRGSVAHDTVFDKERALSFEGDSGPYLQYTHARIRSVVAKAAEAGITADVAAAPATPYEVERLLYRFPEVVAAALAERAPHHVTGYLTELASAFNTFYATEAIADPNDPHAPYKVALADAVATTLKNGLWILAIPVPDKM